MAIFYTNKVSFFLLFCYLKVVEAVILKKLIYRVLNVLERWIACYYDQDFKHSAELQKRLQLFLYHDGLLQKAQFKQHVDKIRFSLKSHKHNAHRHQSTANHLSQLSQLSSSSSPSTNHHTNSNNFNFSSPFVNSSYYTASIIPNHNVNSSNTKQQRPLHNANSSTTALFSFVTPPLDASALLSNVNNTSFLSLEPKEIARYLTLADYYLFKLISLHNVSHGFIKVGNREQEEKAVDYIDLMTKRANMVRKLMLIE